MKTIHIKVHISSGLEYYINCTKSKVHRLSHLTAMRVEGKEELDLFAFFIYISLMFRH